MDSSDNNDNNHPEPRNSKQTAKELGDPDGHFMFPKVNENNPAAHNFKCKICKKVFRDSNDLRNHDTQHKMEFYHCLVCAQVFRSLRSFEVHQASHGAAHTCGVCKKTFQLKSSLTNHLPVHSSDTSKCPHPGCNIRFKHCANHLEHVNYAHQSTKDVQCTHCTKMYQTPSSMRAHRIHKHGYVEDLTPGHPSAVNVSFSRQVH